MRYSAFWTRFFPALFIFLLVGLPALAQPDPFENDVDTQLESLKSINPETRQAAVQVLIRLRDPRAVEPLIALLNDPEEGVGRAVARGLGKLPREKVWKLLMVEMRKGNEEKYLGRYSEALFNYSADLPDLLHAATSPNPIIRTAVISALGGPLLSDKRARKCVLDALLDASSLVRAAAIPPAIHIANGNIPAASIRSELWGLPGGPPPGAPPMAAPQPVMPEPGERVIHRGNVTIRLAPGESPPRPINNVLNAMILSRAFDIDSRVRLAFVKNAPQLEDPRAMGAVRAACGDVDGGVRKVAYTMLFERGEALIEQELAAMKDAAPELRHLALDNAADFDDPRVKEFVAVCMTDENAITRQKACEKLAVLNDPAKITALALAALKDTSAEVRSAAIDALQANGDTKKWLAELEPLLKDENKDVKSAAARALVDSGDSAHNDQYFAMMGDADLRGAVLPMVQNLRDPRVVPFLIAMLKEMDNGGGADTGMLMGSLLRMGPAADEPLLAFANEPGGGQARLMAVVLLTLSGNDKVGAKLTASIRGEDQQEKMMAMFILAMLRDARYEHLLIDELAKGEAPGMGMGMPMDELLSIFDGTQNPAVAKLLVELAKPDGKLKDNDNHQSRIHALRLLAAMEDPLAVDYILKRIANKDPDLAFIVDPNLGEYHVLRRPSETSLFGRGALNDPRIIPIVLKAMTAPKPVAKPAPKAKNNGDIPPPPTVAAMPTAPFEPLNNKQLAANGWNILTAITNPKAKDALHTALRDPNPRVRMIAACALGRFDKDAATPELLPLLAGKDLFMRRQAAETLASFGDSRALPVLSSLMQRIDIRNYDSHKKITQAMARCGSPAVPVLMKNLRGCHNVESFSSHLIEALCITGDPRVPDMLVELTRLDDDQVHMQALRKLVAMKDVRAYDLLIAALSSPSRDIVFSSVQHLGDMGDARAIEPLRKVTARKDYESVALLDALIKLKDPQAIDEALKQFDPQKSQLHLIVLLGETRDPRAYEPLMEVYTRLLAEREKNIPSNNGPHRAERMNDQTADDNLWGVIDALGKLGDKRALEPLVEGLRKTDNPLADNWSPFDGRNDDATPYIKALGELGDQRGVPPITDLLSSYICDPTTVAEALAKLGDGRAVTGILRLANAYDVMGHLMMNSGGDGLPKADPERLPKALGQFRDAASADALKDTLRNGCWRTKMLAAQALGYRGEAWCAWELLPLISDPQPEVRAAAARSLGMLKAENAREGLTALLKDRYPEVRKAAEESLRGMNK